MGGNPEIVWQRSFNDKIFGSPDEDHVYDKFWDVQSIPRDGKLKIMNEPEYQWVKMPLCDDSPGVCADDNGFERPGSLNSIPRDVSSNLESPNEVNWRRN